MARAGRKAHLIAVPTAGLGRQRYLMFHLPRENGPGSLFWTIVLKGLYPNADVEKAGLEHCFLTCRRVLERPSELSRKTGESIGI